MASATVLAVGMAATAAVSAVSAYQQGKAQERAAEYNARLAEQRAEQQAKMTEFDIQQAELDIKRIEQEARATEQRAKIIEQEAIIVDKDAAAAKHKARYDENIHRERIKKLLSEQKAARGASGIAVAGSPLLAMLDTVGKGELDALAIRHTGDVEAGRFTGKANKLRSQALQVLGQAERTRSGKRSVESRIQKLQAQKNILRSQGKGKATALRMKGSAASKAGSLKAGTTLLSGATGAYKTYKGI